MAKQLKPQSGGGSKEDKQNIKDMLNRGRNALQQAKKSSDLHLLGTADVPVVIDDAQSLESFSIYHITQGTQGTAYLLIAGQLHKIDMAKMDIAELLSLLPSLN